MEVKTMQSLVRDLDLMLQPRTVPRYKTWLPLATQQLRLRSLVRVIGYNLEVDKRHETCWFYYTLHRSNMSSPLYTSEPIDNVSTKWASLEVPTIHATGLSTASEIVLRLWRRTVSKDPTSDVTVFTWGISFTGLAYMGPKLPTNLETVLRHNSLIFHLHGGFFAPSYCLLNPPDLKRYLYMSISPAEIRESYTVLKLCSLRSKMQALKQQTESAQALRERIASGDDVQSPKYKQTSLNRLLQPKRISREKKAEILRIRKELEIAKFRTKLLEQERVRKMGELRSLNHLHMTITEENQDHGSDLMERYRELNKDIERLREWRQSHLETREVYIQTTTKLVHRRRQLISELCLIYPINQENERKFTINNVHLPDSEELETSNDSQVAVALGFVAHTTQMIANFLNVPTRYPILHYGSRSRVVDHITDSLPDKDRQFPLFARSKDKLQFHYAVYLLNKNIAQLRWYCGLPTADLRVTLPNLASLIINIKPNQPLDSSKRTFSGSSLDTDMGNGKHNVPLTPPIQKAAFDKCERTPRSMSQLKSVKSGLGSSLDQGLDKPVQSLVLTNKSKRICKSEESAIDDKHLSLPRDTSSDETLDDTVFENSGTHMGRHLDRFGKVVGSDIEILIPVSVSKQTYASENIEDSDSVKQRSSNSISSCEMALSGSQNEIGDSPNDSGTGKNSTNGECVSLEGNDNSGNPRLSSITNETDSKSISSNGSSANAYEMYDRDKSQDTLTELGQKEHSVVSKNSVSYSEDTLSNSCASLDDKPCFSYNRADSKPIIGAASSYPDNYNSGMTGLTSRGYESDGRSDETNTRVRLDSISRVDSNASSEEPTEFSHLLGKKSQSPKSQSHNRASNDQEENDFRASNDYIDSMRRSSENVYARTEALASKKTSFKVMKPRT